MQFQNMIPYNTGMPKLVLPEYGRLVHEMAEICANITDREERNSFAGVLVEIMKSTTQDKNKEPDEKKYWDHLYIIGQGKLDIDSPFGTPEEEVMKAAPAKMPYTGSHFEKRQYGRIVQQMIKKVSKMENSEDKDTLVELLANHVKKLQTMHNPENASDELVFADIDTISGGSIKLSKDMFTLLDFKEEKPAKNQKKKKNR